MNYPVLIAARNESEHLQRTLESLPSDTEVLVVPNGCTDNTADIARSFGATVLSSTVEGKMPAIQTGLRHLGKRALEPVVLLDADTRPIVGSKWQKGFRAGLEQVGSDKPAYIVGPFVFRERDLPTIAWRTLGTMRQQWRTKNDQVAGDFAGRNTLIHLHDEGILEQVMDLPNIWPGEDVVIKDTIVENGGTALKLLHPLAAAYTTSDRFPSILARLAGGKSQAMEDIHRSYVSDAPPQSVHFREFQDIKA